MALKKKHALANGLVCEEAYIRVEDIHVVSKSKISFIVRFYSSSTIGIHFDECYLSCDYKIDGNNLYTQSYDYIKTLEEFLTAINC